MNENRFLLIGTLFNGGLGIVGMLYFFLASSEAILLDGLFNLTYFVTGLFTLKVAKLVQHGDDAQFPFGYAYFEPLVNGVKGVLVFGVSISAFMGAVEALLEGGRSINSGPAVTYGIVATIGCAIPAIVMAWGTKKTRSPLVRADAENWIVNSAISAVVLLAFLGVYAVQGTNLAFLAPYIDPALVILVVAISISVPVRLAWNSLLELLNRTPNEAILQQVKTTVAACTAKLPVRELLIRVVQPGRTRMVLAYVVLPKDYRVPGLEALDNVQSETLARLREDHAETCLDMVFTADPKMGAPAPVTGKAGAA